MIDFKIGIMGAGNIAGKVADTLNKLDMFKVHAIASRDIEKANQFGDTYGVEKRYGSYEELVQDPDVELIYIATPHSHHAEQAKMCINAGKPVLVEKAFSYNTQTAAEVLKLSEEKGVFCGEAMWIRFMPMYRIVADYIHKGVIGHIRNITCSLGYDLHEKERVLQPELAGGALLDLGVYAINLMTMFYGPEMPVINASCAKFDTGVDAMENIQFVYSQGKTGNAFISATYQPDNNARIYGDYGYIEIDNMNCPECIRVYKKGEKIIETKPSDLQISGYEFEFMSARNAIIVGKTECPEMSHAETLRVMTICDNLRKLWNMKYPME